MSTWEEVAERLRALSEGEVTERYVVRRENPLLLDEIGGDEVLEEGDDDFTIGDAVRQHRRQYGLDPGDVVRVRRERDEFTAVDVESGKGLKRFRGDEDPIPGEDIIPGSIDLDKLAEDVATQTELNAAAATAAADSAEAQAAADAAAGAAANAQTSANNAQSSANAAQASANAAGAAASAAQGEIDAHEALTTTAHGGIVSQAAFDAFKAAPVFTGDLSVGGGANRLITVAGTTTGWFMASSPADSHYDLYATGAGANLKRSRLFGAGGFTRLQKIDDAYTVAEDMMVADHATRRVSFPVGIDVAGVSVQNTRETERVIAYAGAFQEGVVDAGHMKCTVGTGMVINIATGLALIQDDANVTRLSPVEGGGSVTLAASGSGNPRIDQVIATLDQNNPLGVTFSVRQGTPTAGATLDNRSGALALPNNAIRLCDVLIPPMASSLLAANVRDRRKWARGASWQKAVTADVVNPAPFAWAHVHNPGLITRVECSGAHMQISFQAFVHHAGGSHIRTGLWWSDVASGTSRGWEQFQTSVNGAYSDLNREWNVYPPAGTFNVGPVYETDGTGEVRMYAQTTASHERRIIITGRETRRVDLFND